MLGGEPRTTLFAALVAKDSEGLHLEELDNELLLQRVQRVVGAKEALRGDAADGVVAAARQKSRDRASRGMLPKLTVQTRNFFK